MNVDTRMRDVVSTLLSHIYHLSASSLWNLPAVPRGAALGWSVGHLSFTGCCLKPKDSGRGGGIKEGKSNVRKTVLQEFQKQNLDMFSLNQKLMAQIS